MFAVRLLACATKPRMRLDQRGATFNAVVNQLRFGSAIARYATGICDNVAKPELINNYTVRSPALFLSYAKFCRPRRLKAPF